MSRIGGGKMGGRSGQKGLQLSTTDGSDSFTIRDGDGFPVFRVDSSGNIFTKKAIKRI